MDFLKETVQIITRRKLQNIEILDKTLIASKDSILCKLYEGIADNQIQSDQDAINYLYGKSDDADVKSYRQLKARFKKRLLNTLFFIDVNSKDYDTDVQKYYFECVRSLQILNIVQKYGGNQRLVFEIIQDYYAIALKYEFYDVLSEYCQKLMTYYSVKCSIPKFEETKADFLKFKAIRNEIDEVYILFSTINCTLGAPKKPTNEQIEYFHDEVNKLSQKVSSYLSKSYIGLSNMLLYDFEGDPVKVGEICDDLLIHLDTKDNAFRQSFKGITNYFKISTLLQTRQYEMGIKYIDKNIHNVFGLNWFVAMDTKLKFALNLRDIELAKATLKEVYTHKTFTILPENVLEKWYINEGYIVFYDNYLNDGNYKFNLGKLLNQVPHYYHDKSGYNFSLIILQLLFLLARKDRDGVLGLLNSLKTYKTRYIKDEEQVRSAEFVRLLLYFEKKGLNKRRVDSLTMSYLNAVPKNSFIFDHEIIAYETLLDIITDLA